MPPRRAVRGRSSRRNIEEQGVPNALEVQPQGEVTKAEFREAIRMLSQVATYQVGERDNRQEVASTSRIRELLRMNPPSLTGSSVTEDSENFIEDLKRVFDVMHVADAERVELAYQMNGVARIWFNQWKKNRVEDAAIVTWDVFESALMGCFFPRELREAKIKEFLTLNPESMSAHEYIKQGRQGSYADKEYGPSKAYDPCSIAQSGSKPPACTKCGRNHSWMWRDGSTSCFKCDQNGYFMRECLENRQSNGKEGNKAQSSSVASPDRGAPRRATSDPGGSLPFKEFIVIVSFSSIIVVPW
ncbi:uncharacterized protein LOC125830955 [Solanum verrucosum]|uniref:uncharacterized protein LOC125830955 n=1 Tax=Solanum verrucosum TaxID=315347 RepID=UPI0020D1101F|nr:uncharacterized protein LOC125830955 [Solanum verrucosum]